MHYCRFTFVLAMVALLTTGKPLPEETKTAEPISVIYQSAEDGLADTIKPRLEASGADCSRVLVIDESDKDLNLCDEQLEQSVRETYAKLIVLDPLQAYDGCSGTNFNRPAWEELMKLVENDEVATIIVKDMSRLGRDYLLVPMEMRLSSPFSPFSSACKYQIIVLELEQTFGGCYGKDSLYHIGSRSCCFFDTRRGRNGVFP